MIYTLAARGYAEVCWHIKGVPVEVSKISIGRDGMGGVEANGTIRWGINDGRMDRWLLASFQNSPFGPIVLATTIHARDVFVCILVAFLFPTGTQNPPVWFTPGSYLSRSSMGG